MSTPQANSLTTAKDKDPFWEQNLYEVKNQDLEKLPVLGIGKIPYAKSGPEESVLTVYDTTGYYHWRYFRKEDIRIMKVCAIRWMVAVVNKKNTGQPWWHYTYWLEQQTSKTPGVIFQHKLKDMFEHEVELIYNPLFEQYWKLYLEFCEYRYICGRYKNFQKTLWNDMYADHEINKEIFFAGCSEEYIQLLLRVTASYLGIKLHNINGD